MPNPALGQITAIVVNLTATQAAGTGFITAGAATGPNVGSGIPNPPTSFLNFSITSAGGSEALQNLVIIPVCGPTGTATACRRVNPAHFDVRADVNNVHLVGDVVGFIAPPTPPMCMTMTSPPFMLTAATPAQITDANGTIIPVMDAAGNVAVALPGTGNGVSPSCPAGFILYSGGFQGTLNNLDSLASEGPIDTNGDNIPDAWQCFGNTLSLAGSTASCFAYCCQ